MSRELCKDTENEPYFNKKRPVFQGGVNKVVGSLQLAVGSQGTVKLLN